MKSIRKAFLCVLLNFSALFSFSQSDGVINRVATSVAGRAVLDPNGDGYTSTTTSGFLGNDVANSEIPYKVVPPFSTEPYGDLRRGPSHQFSDFVPGSGSDGFYSYYDGTNLLFRFRLGSVMSGSKGYSVLIDTDGKFGATGANADPNYVAATTGTNGNPGFEIEIVLETNFRIAVYNVDGTSSPTLIKSYSNWQDMSQVSIAATSDNGTPDFYMDFYIPFSDLQAAPFNLTTSSSIRLSSTTVMSPQAAIGGPKSDIYGLNDGNYSSTNDEYTAYINAQCGTTIANLSSGGSGLCGRCTSPPAVTSPIGTGTVTVSGTWTASTLSGAATTATITVYKNGVSVGTVAGVTTGSTWSLASVTTAGNDVITAKAQATGESMCLVSNSVIANSCNSSTNPAKPILSCTSGSKGLGATNQSTGWTIHVDNLTRNILNDNVTNTGGLFGGFTGTSPNISWTYSGGCSSGAPLTSGSYKVYYVDNATGCVSEPAYFCAAGNGGSALAGSLAVPVITTPSGGAFTTATTSISGTTTAGASAKLYIDGLLKSTVTANGSGVFTFSGIALLVGQQLYIVVELNTGTVSTSYCENQTSVFTVTCYTNPPLINTDKNNQVTAGSPITGTSGEPTGTTIRIYNVTGPALVATTTVQSGGTWTTSGVPYNAVAGTSYYANAQNGTCAVSANSSTVTAAAQTSSARCGSITGPVASGATTVSGTLSSAVASTTVSLYEDGEFIGSTTTSTTAWTVSGIAASTIYSNAVLSIGIQETGKQEVACPSTLTVSCTPTPVAPVYTPTSSSINLNQSITYTVSNAASGSFYGIADAVTGKSYASGKWATSNGNLSITTNTFTSSGTYNIVIKATSISGVNVCSATGAPASINVSGSLPLTLISFTGQWKNDKVLLSWITESELNVSHFEIERSVTGNNFSKIGEQKAIGSYTIRQTYSFTDDAQNAPVIYYRLRMVDEDGRSKYSQVVVLKANNHYAIGISPNPFTNKINIDYESKSSSALEVTILDLNGKTLRTNSYTLVTGLNHLTINNTEPLASGVYFLKLKDLKDNSISYYKVAK